MEKVSAGKRVGYCLEDFFISPRKGVHFCLRFFSFPGGNPERNYVANKSSLAFEKKLMSFCPIPNELFVES